NAGSQSVTKLSIEGVKLEDYPLPGFPTLLAYDYGGAKGALWTYTENSSELTKLSLDGKIETHPLPVCTDKPEFFTTPNQRYLFVFCSSNLNPRRQEYYILSIDLVSARDVNRFLIVPNGQIPSGIGKPLFFDRENCIFFFGSGGRAHRFEANK